MGTLLLVAVTVLCFSSGDISLKQGMKTLGGVESVRPRALLRGIGEALGSPFILAGVALQIAAFLAFLTALSRDDLSYVFPLTATSDILTTLAARYLLRERVTPLRWAGVVLVTAGIALISAT